MNTGLLVLLALIVVIGVGMVRFYNQLVARRNRWQNAYSQIEVQLQRRYELIPNLVETAKGYMAHERETLEGVTAARAQAKDLCDKAHGAPGDGAALGRLASAEARLAGALGRFNLVVEDYPELKADARMRDLSESLETTENRVAFARQAYSDSVEEYNRYRQSFPAVIVADLFGFRDAMLFDIEDPEARRPVKVGFV